MTRREHRLVELALQILRRLAGSHDESVKGEAMQLALRVLQPYANKESLKSFWSVADNPNRSQRSHLLRRIFESIELDVLRSASGLRPRRPGSLAR